MAQTKFKALINIEGAQGISNVLLCHFILRYDDADALSENCICLWKVWQLLLSTHGCRLRQRFALCSVVSLCDFIICECIFLQDSTLVNAQRQMRSERGRRRALCLCLLVSRTLVCLA